MDEQPFAVRVRPVTQYRTSGTYRSAIFSPPPAMNVLRHAYRDQTRIALTALCGLVLSACGGAPVDSRPPEQDDSQVTLRIDSGGGQQTLQGDLFQFPIVVAASDQFGEPVSGLSIGTRILAGGGSVDEAAVTTDSFGKASLHWRAGNAYEQRIRFSAGEESVEASGVSLYRYRPPFADTDGWPIRSLDTAVAQPLFDVVDDVRAGRWQNIHSLLVAKGGEFVFEAYFPGQTSSGQQVDWDRLTPHEVQSASKSYRSALIGMAIDQGLIAGVDEPLTTFFPDFAADLAGDKSGVTLEHVLTMSSGLQWNESGAAQGNTNNSLSRMYGTPPSNWTPFVLSLPLQFDPGSTFVYNTGASIMLNDILARGTGMPVSNFVRTFMVNPMETEVVPGVGYPLGAATLPRDMLKLGQVFLTGGMWKDTRILSEWWVEESLTERFQFSSGVAYGYQWWMRTVTTPAASYRIQYAAGNGGQYIILVPDLDVVVVSTGGNFGSSLMQQIWSMLQLGVLEPFE